MYVFKVVDIKGGRLLIKCNNENYVKKISGEFKTKLDE